MVSVAHGELKPIVSKDPLDTHPMFTEEGRDVFEECHGVATEGSVYRFCEGQTAVGVDSRDLKDRLTAPYTGQLLKVDPYLRPRPVMDDRANRLTHLDA